MKKLILLAAMHACIVFAYGQQVKDILKISSDQLPAAVKSAFANQFDASTDTGSWIVLVERKVTNGKTEIIPLWYSFQSGEKRAKQEVRFSPKGDIILVKGMEKKTSPSTQPNTQ